MSDPAEAAITMVVPAYRVGAMINDALDSLLAQDRQGWKAIIIDDGDPEAEKFVAPYLSDPRFRFLKTDNGGPSTARNRGMVQADTPFIGLLDGDDILEPDFLSSMLPAIEASPTIGFVTCNSRFFGADREGELYSSYCPQQLPATLERVLRREFNLVSQTVMRREAIEGIGYFDTSLKSSEDLDAWIRMLEAGWELAYVPRALAHYRRHAGQASRNSTGMLRTELVAMKRATERLRRRPEEAAAAERCRTIEREIAIAEAFSLLAEGQVRQALAEFDRVGTGTLSARWRFVLLLIRIAPFMTGPLMKLRRGT